ncbi:hypothetical protein BT69DRAFT_1089620 [Atractiella rhizophila]|nr:hypothetical protein BT69DRAFT_1089620 [Atractiella rhizophila]
MSTRSANQDAFDSENSKPSSPLAFSFSRASKDMAHPSVIPDPPTDFATPSTSSKDPFPPALAPVGKGLPENDRLMAPVTKRFIQYTLRFYVFVLLSSSSSSAQSQGTVARHSTLRLLLLVSLLSTFRKFLSFSLFSPSSPPPKTPPSTTVTTDAYFPTSGTGRNRSQSLDISRIHGRMQRLPALHHRRPLSSPPACSPPNLFPPYHPRQWRSGTQAAIVSTVGGS